MSNIKYILLIYYFYMLTFNGQAIYDQSDSRFIAENIDPLAAFYAYMNNDQFTIYFAQQVLYSFLWTYSQWTREYSRMLEAIEASEDMARQKRIAPNLAAFENRIMTLMWTNWVLRFIELSKQGAEKALSEGQTWEIDICIQRIRKATEFIRSNNEPLLA